MAYCLSLLRQNDDAQYEYFDTWDFSSRKRKKALVRKYLTIKIPYNFCVDIPNLWNNSSWISLTKLKPQAYQVAGRLKTLLLALKTEFICTMITKQTNSHFTIMMTKFFFLQTIHAAHMIFKESQTLWLTFSWQRISLTENIRRKLYHYST